MSNICKNCDSTFQGEFCNSCGQRVMPRFTGSFLWQGLHKDLFEVDKGLLLTLKELWANPGKMVLAYVNGRTKSYYSPLKYLIFWTAIYFIIQPLVNKEDNGFLSLSNLLLNAHHPFSRESLEDFVQGSFQFMTMNVDLFFIGLIPFVSTTSYFLHPSSNFNFTENIILFTYFSGQVVFIVVIMIVLTPQVNAIKEFSFWVLIPPIIIQYYILIKMIKQFFNQSWGSAIWRGLVGYYSGMILYFGAQFLVFNLVKYI